MKVHRRGLGRGQFVVGTAAAFGALAVQRYPAGAAEFTYRWAIDVTQDHPMGVRAIEAGAKITTATNGRLEVRVFPNGSLGGQSQVLSQVRLGAVELANSGDFLIESVAPLAGMSCVPFTFTSHQQAWAAMDGALGKTMRAGVAKIGVYPMERVWDVGFRQLYNSLRPIHTPADIKGLKMRIPDSPTSTALFKAFGTSPAPITSAEMYTALQTHLIDACEQPLISFQVRRLFELQKYASLTSHVWTGYRMLANGDAWQKLPANIRDTAEQIINAGGNLCRQDIVRTDGTLQAQLKGEGVVFNNADIPSFKNAVRAAGLYAQWRDHYGAEAWGQLESAVGQLG